jgi:hypothetical protein
MAQIPCRHDVSYERAPRRRPPAPFCPWTLDPEAGRLAARSVDGPGGRPQGPGSRRPAPCQRRPASGIGPRTVRTLRPAASGRWYTPRDVHPGLCTMLICGINPRIPGPRPPAWHGIAPRVRGPMGPAAGPRPRATSDRAAAGPIGPPRGKGPPASGSRAPGPMGPAAGPRPRPTLDLGGRRTHRARGRPPASGSRLRPGLAVRATPARWVRRPAPGPALPWTPAAAGPIGPQGGPP